MKKTKITSQKRFKDVYIDMQSENFINDDIKNSIKRFILDNIKMTDRFIIEQKHRDKKFTGNVTKDGIFWVEENQKSGDLILYLKN